MASLISNIIFYTIRLNPYLAFSIPLFSIPFVSKLSFVVFYKLPKKTAIMLIEKMSNYKIREKNKNNDNVLLCNIATQDGWEIISLVD